MNDARMFPSAVELPSGLVLVSGGGDKLLWTGSSNRIESLLSAELYDPGRGTWSLAGALTTPRAAPPAFLLSSGPHAGKVMLVGGSRAAVETDDGWLHGELLASTDVYTPTTAAWAPGPPMLHAPLGVIQLKDGRLLAVGSFDVVTGPPGPEVQILDPSEPEPSWRLVSPMGIPRTGFAMALLANGEVLVVSGNKTEIGMGQMSTDVERYDPVNDLWSKAASLPFPRTGEALIRLPSGGVLLAGGCPNPWFNCEDPRNPPTLDALIYDPDSDVWQATSPMHYPHALAQAVMLNSGKVLLAAGNFKKTSQNGIDYYPCPTSEIFDPESKTWSVTEPMPRYVMGGGAMVKLSSGAVLYAGGHVNGNPGEDEYLAIREAQLFQ